MEAILIIWLIITGLGMVFIDRRLFQIAEALRQLNERGSAPAPSRSRSADR